MTTKKILIAPNSFKECADSVTISELIRDNLNELKNTDLIIKPVSDGGDGFLRVCQFQYGGEIRKYSISTAYNDSPFECPILYCKNSEEVYIESAEVLGSKRIPPSHRNPLWLSSKGLGELLKKIELDVQLNKIDVSYVFIGIGGTATIDLGIGMISKLGLRLFNSTGNELRVLPEYYEEVEAMDYKPFDFSFKIIPVVDVTNPLLGSNGGVSVFGRQKGADQKVILYLEKSFNHLLKMFENNNLQVSYDNLFGAGGGISASFQIFYKASLLYSSDFIKYNLKFNNYISKANIDYAITGEGAYDYQSEFGKGADVILDLFKLSAKKIFLICGKIDSESIPKLPKNVVPIELSNYFSSEIESIRNFKEGIKRACLDIVRLLNF